MYYHDDSVDLYLGDARKVMAALPDSSVDCIVTSPPYYGLRDYGSDDQLGAEPDPRAYVDRLVAIMHEAMRVLATDGTMWLNLGDSYAGSGKGRLANGAHSSGGKQATNLGTITGKLVKTDGDRPPKNLLGIPWRTALALQDDGWYLRSEIIWHVPNRMPESVRDRPVRAHETVFLFARSRNYFYDAESVREPASGDSGTEAMRAQRDVWSIPHVPFTGGHFATFPPELPERCIRAGCRRGGVVLDPFSGSGTTGMAAQRLGCRYIGIDVNPSYLALSLRTRLSQGALLDGMEASDVRA